MNSCVTDLKRDEEPHEQTNGHNEDIWDGTSHKQCQSYNVSIPMSNDCNCFLIDKMKCIHIMNF